jgi:uncharacterized membrane protein HdeD (DUF308 family)
VWFIVLRLALGIAVVAIPPSATDAVQIIAGRVFSYSGLAGVIMTVCMRRAPAIWWSLLSAILAIWSGSCCIDGGSVAR